VAGSPRLESTTLAWRIKEQADLTVVELRGELNEAAELDRLRQRLKGQVVLHLGAVRRINSGGVREWVNFITALSSSAQVTLTHCSPSVVTQLNMIYNFRGKAKVRSFMAPYTCTKCDNEQERLIDVQTQLSEGKTTRMPSFRCDTCGGELEFDEVPDRYLSFLLEL
jgi:anti-anti-sigma regulatory factor